jgi:hypothetical protein
VVVSLDKPSVPLDTETAIPIIAAITVLWVGDIVLSLESINRELRKELGIELYVDVIPDFTNQVSAVQGFLKVRRCNIEWVELSGED